MSIDYVADPGHDHRHHWVIHPVESDHLDFSVLRERLPKNFLINILPEILEENVAIANGSFKLSFAIIFRLGPVNVNLFSDLERVSVPRVSLREVLNSVFGGLVV